MPSRTDSNTLRLALPKGRMEKEVFRLLAEAEVRLDRGDRTYRPRISLPGIEVKILKPQSIVEMLHHGSRDIGFTGADWVEELDANLTEVLDTELDPVRLVAACPKDFLANGVLPQTSLVVASEYKNLTKKWIADKKLDATFMRSYGATEVLPPEDADCIVDNTQSGATLRANGLEIVDELMSSSTRLFANPEALKDPGKEKDDRQLGSAASLCDRGSKESSGRGKCHCGKPRRGNRYSSLHERADYFQTPRRRRLLCQGRCSQGKARAHYSRGKSQRRNGHHRFQFGTNSALECLSLRQKTSS